jgi:hypothetical protein
MQHVDFIQRIALAMVNSSTGDWHPEARAAQVMKSPCPPFEKDPTGWAAWKQEAEGRITYQEAEAFAKGFRAESERFEV